MPVDLADLPTPALLVDVARCEANIATVAGSFSAAGVALRPHIKTSKCLEVVRRQYEAGAAGFTCSTPAEVRALGEAGFAGLLWAHQPVGRQKVAFAVDAARRWGMTAIVDSRDVAEPLSAHAVDEGIVVSVLLEVDTGHHRTGVIPDRSLETARLVASLPGLELDGVLTHEGHLAAYGADRVGLEAAGRGIGSSLAGVARRLSEAGLPCQVVSVGSTPGLSTAPFAPGVTEGRPGTYVFYDANQVRLGSTTIDRCALTVLARVVSRQRKGQAIIDAGLKAMSSDALTPQVGAGIVCDVTGVPMADVSFPTANEEHGFLTGPGADRLQVGDVVRIVPNHACGTVNMWSRLHAVSDDSVEQWPVVARH
ncbi:MAG: alanine racemase [Actinomycetota bacterium]|nr:alanine racemase [Actinomycetota bacterium]